MAKYRHALPQLNGGLFLTDGGIETDLIFNDGFDLPHFAAFTLLNNEAGRKGLKNYFSRYASIAASNDTGFILESPTWRASADWGSKLGYSEDAMADANRKSIEMLLEIREQYETSRSPMVISGCLGPRGDGYDLATVMEIREAERYHAPQVRVFSETEADFVTAITMTNIPEAVGITRTAQKVKMPAVISFTVETDGRLPTGETLQDAIETVDEATDSGPAYFMVNCAHPTHFEHMLASGKSWVKRLRGLRANASRQSHAELNEAPHLDDGDPVELGEQYCAIRRHLGHVNVLGGCCGTDHRHITEIYRACRDAA
ncbi:MAG: homocysteine S-methyltransferase family protein [Gammaproteobacteria bacterium]|nr:homocysteine S-methyltransferase family protein [Gammaproteobacteria bacterium]